MDEPTWHRFCNDVPASANERVTVLLEHLAEHGEGDLPRPGLRSISAAVGGEGRTATLEARGCVLTGRVSSVDGRSHFFVTRITIDDLEAAPTRPRRRRKQTDERQGKLELEGAPAKGGASDA